MITENMSTHEALAVIGAKAVGEGIYKPKNIIINGEIVFSGSAYRTWEWLRENYSEYFDEK